MARGGRYVTPSHPPRLRNFSQPLPPAIAVTQTRLKTPKAKGPEEHYGIRSGGKRGERPLKDRPPARWGRGCLLGSGVGKEAFGGFGRRGFV